MLHAKVLAIQSELAARRLRGSSVCIQQAWDAALPIAEGTRDRLITAGFENGARDDLLSAFVREDLAVSLSSTMKSHFGQDGVSAAAMVARYGAHAHMLASRIPDIVRVRRADFETQQPTRLERITKGLLRRPLIAWPVFIYGIVAALVGQGPLLSG